MKSGKFFFAQIMAPFSVSLCLRDNFEVGLRELYVGATSLLLRQWQSQTREMVNTSGQLGAGARLVIPPLDPFGDGVPSIAAFRRPGCGCVAARRLAWVEG
jgi:hypothetical protein